MPLDCMVIAPITGTSMSKFANALTDSPVLMAAKATLRNQNPVVFGISTNDALRIKWSQFNETNGDKKYLFYSIWSR